MSKKQETISDIVAELRRLNPEKFLSTPWYCEPLPNRMRLKPVLEVNREDCDCGSEWAIRCMYAVNEAQRIYKEGDGK